MPLFSPPDAPFLLRNARTAAAVWLGARGALLFIGLLHVGALAAALLITSCTLAVWMDLRRSRQLVFYANLGISPGWSLMAAAATCAALELTAALALVLIGSHDAALLR